MRILIGYSACPLTRAAFERHGHEVWTCDLLPARDDSPRHFQCDVWEVAGDRWDLGLFHPMCTYLTVSAAWAFTDGPYHQKVKAGTLVGAARRQAREEALENFRRLLALPYPKAIENPLRLGSRRSPSVASHLSQPNPKVCRFCQPGFGVFHRFCAAFLAMADLSSAVRALARAFPPFSPPRRPRLTAAGSLPESSAGLGGGALPVTWSGNSRRLWRPVVGRPGPRPF